LWGTTLGLFCSNYVFFFMLSWLPVYLVRERGFSMGQMTTLTSASYTLMAVCALLGGLVVDRYIKRGGSANIGYKTTMAVVNVGAVACMLAMAYGSRPLAVAGIFVYQALNGASAAGLYAMPEIFGGTAATGRWVGIQNSLGSLAGVVAPWLTGIIINLTGHFTLAFMVASAMSLLGLVGWLGLLPKVEAIDWELDADPASGAPRPEVA
jgi:MFS family permease